MKFEINTHKTRIPELIEQVGNLFGFTLDDITGRCKRRDYISARFCVYHVLRNILKLTYSEVGRHTNRDHGAVANGIESLAAWCEQEPLALKTRTACELIANKWVTATNYSIDILPTECSQPESNLKAPVNTNKAKTKGKPVVLKGVVPKQLAKEENCTYIYYYNTNNSIKYILEKQLHNPFVFKALVEYIEYRRESRKKITQSGMDKLMAKLSSANAALVIQAIEDSIANGWAGVFLNNKNNAKNNKTNNSGYNAKAKGDYSGAVNKRGSEEVGEVF
jgi:hypothetical protein